MIIGVEQLCDIIHMAGLVILSHRAAAPVNVHIRALVSAHGNDQLLLVVIVLLMYLVDGDVRIIRHESLNSAFLNALGRILGSDIPKGDGQRLRGQLRNVLCFLSLYGNSSYKHGTEHGSCQCSCK